MEQPKKPEQPKKKLNKVDGGTDAIYNPDLDKFQKTVVYNAVAYDFRIRKENGNALYRLGAHEMARGTEVIEIEVDKDGNVVKEFK